MHTVNKYHMSINHLLQRQSFSGLVGKEHRI